MVHRSVAIVVNNSLRLKTCIKCGKEISIDDVFCGYCGTKQNALDSEQFETEIGTTPSSQENEVLVTDSSLSNAINTQKMDDITDSRESKASNNSLVEEKPNDSIEESSPQKSSSIKYIVIGIIAVIIVGAGLYLIKSGSDNSTTYQVAASDSIVSDSTKEYEDASTDGKVVDTSAVVLPLENTSLPFEEGTKLSKIASMNGVQFALCQGNRGWSLDVYYKGQNRAYVNIEDLSFSQSGISKINKVIEEETNEEPIFIKLLPEDFTDDDTIYNID